MQLIINGEAKTFSDVANLMDLVAALALTQKRIAIELDGEIVPRSQFQETILRDGSQLEVVVAVGGG